jgi:serine/threonine protein kinase/tetratricopeptide (TPR) repeat protein
MTEESLFHEVLAKPVGERAAFLDAACAKEPHLRAAVEGLLAAHEASGELLGPPTAEFRSDAPSEPPRSEPPQSEQPRPEPPRPAITSVYQPTNEPGVVVGGRYTLVERIGEGGMGEVWVAKQTEPVKRKVALKLIKAGMDSKAVLQRFDQERQALALMDHPNIAKVLDGGVTVDHRPYFVMELVNGLPLTKFCDQMKLPVRERLELFTPICQAVQHAHQKGIVHRDLKPSNILVTIIDGKPVPKVIDFGVAKATSGKLTDETMSTGFGAVVGTLEYMAPEQAGFAGADIDTRADIYSLGVILYELLTGLRPIDGERLRTAALSEMVRIIEDEVPSKPSTRLSTHESLPSLAALRQTEPKKLMAMLRGELDWVVMKCLEKQRDRRYDTANGLARDVQRYLADEPVEARPPSAGYRIRKFVRRHKASAIAASLVVVALVTGMAGTTWQWIRAERARADEADQRAAAQANEQKANAAAAGERLAKLEAQAKEQLAVAAAEKEKTARLEEERQRKFAEAISRFVQDDFLALTSVEGQDRFGGEGKEALSKDTTLEQLLDRAAAKLRARQDLDPRIEAELCWIVGVNYRGAGRFTKAIEFLERAVKLRTDLLGRDHPHTTDAMNSLGVAYSADGQYDRAVALLEETLKLQKTTLGPNYRNTLVTMGSLATAYRAANKLELAVPLFEKTLQLNTTHLGPDNPYTLIAMTNLASTYSIAGKHEAALALFEQALPLKRARLGPEHPLTVTCMANLAETYAKAGKFESALPLLEETLKLRKVQLGPDHPDTLVTMDNLASAYKAAGRLDLAVPLFEEALKLRIARLGPDHRDTIFSMGILATAYSAAGQLDLAIPLYEETLKLRIAQFGPDHPHTLTTMNNLATAYWQRKQLDRSIPLFEETLKRREATLGRDHPDTLLIVLNLGINYRDAGRLNEALPLLEEGYHEFMKRDPQGPDAITGMENLARAYEAAGRWPAAHPLLEEALRLKKATLGSDHRDTLLTTGELGYFHWRMKQFDEAIALYEERWKLQAKKLGRDHLETLETAGNLGVNFKDAGRLQEAIPLLEEVQQAARKYPQLATFTASLIDAYAAAGEHAKLADLLQEQLSAARQALPSASPQLAGQLAQTGMTLLRQKQWTDAESFLRECLAIFEAHQGDAWMTFDIQSMLGGALLGQEKFAEAEPLLVNGYHGMQQRAKTIPPQGRIRLAEALQRLVQLYEATDKADESAKWRNELEAFNAAQLERGQQP